jgi:ATP-dependent Clp protease ATP-binding subunit ClpA
VFERFTDRGRRVLVLAQEEARLLNHNFIGTEHLLLGLIHEGEAVAAKALESLGVTLEAARVKVAELDGPIPSENVGSPPFTPRAKKVLECSMREAVQLGHNYIGTEHLLLGLIREGEGVATQVLVSLGADLGQVRERVVELFSGQPLTESKPLGAARLRMTPGVGVGPPQRPSGTPPDCPHCRSRLATAARLRRITLTETGGEPEHTFLVVYCGDCGRALSFSTLT